MGDQPDVPVGPKEEEIRLEDLPEDAREYLSRRKADLERIGFRWQGYCKRTFSGPFTTTQFAVDTIGECSIVASAFHVKRDISFLHGLLTSKKRREQSRMFQSLFDNGCRLVTTDYRHYSGEAEVWAPPCFWSTVDSSASVATIADKHRSNVKRLVEQQRFKIVEIRDMKDYQDFPKRYEYTPAS